MGKQFSKQRVLPLKLINSNLRTCPHDPSFMMSRKCVPGCHWPSHISSTRFPQQESHLPKSNTCPGSAQTSSPPDRSSGLRGADPGYRPEYPLCLGNSSSRGHASCPRHLLYLSLLSSPGAMGPEKLDGMSCLLGEC